MAASPSLATDFFFQGPPKFNQALDFLRAIVTSTVAAVVKSCPGQTSFGSSHKGVVSEFNKQNEHMLLVRQSCDLF